MSDVPWLTNLDCDGTISTTATLSAQVVSVRCSPRAVAMALGVSERTVRKWVARFRATGSVAPGKVGSHRPWLLDSHRELVHRLVPDPVAVGHAGSGGTQRDEAIRIPHDLWIPIVRKLLLIISNLDIIQSCLWVRGARSPGCSSTTTCSHPRTFNEFDGAHRYRAGLPSDDQSRHNDYASRWR